MEGLGPRKTSKLLGPMDKFANPINPNSSASGKNRNTMKQQSLNDIILKERTHVIQRYVAKWVYQACIPFNALIMIVSLQMVEAIGQFGPSFKPPSQLQLREPLVKEEFETTKEALKKQEQSWKVDECSIMTDAWTDRKRRSIMNLCVNCKEGTTFLSSKDSSAEAHTGENIFKYVLSAIEEVGPENVVQVVTDNASNNMAAAKMLKVKMPSIFWSSCATHTINLMLEDIGKLPKFKNTLEEAKSFTIFIYAHHTTLAFMRTFTRKRDIVRPGVTSTDWEKFKWSKSVKGKAAYNTVLSTVFWNEILYPDDLEKQNIFVNIEFGKYLNKEGPFRRPLALKGCEKNDEFYNPVTWWTNYGSDTPNLQTIAKRILSLTASSSGCERNWSTFEGIDGQEKKVDILLANDASNAQGWIVDDGDDEVEPGSGLEDGEVRDLKDDFQYDNDVAEENVEFESDDDVVFQLDEYVVEDEALETLS
ncbi:hypothetical protein Dsin_025092 [Dipteronia sinensis]|uniref:DUF659 domain-containing protein n=1 Tax=Dipteronia sinensis TaxID=43782 RepID=A0AAD9ZVN1_9ROSI|nr:hypothetical protein Dsin_025092 [Dipteronia sinensis]